MNVSCAVVDSWGKIPSAVFSGNLFEFGGFSECFHIKRDENLYKTQYCLGKMIFDVNGISLPQPKQNNVNNFNIPKLMQTDNESTIQPRIGLLL